MFKSRARLAADWFAKLRQNAVTGEVENTDIVEAEAAVENIDLSPIENQLATKVDEAYVQEAIAGISGGKVLQVVTGYTTSETSYSAPANNGNTIMSIMDVYITPKSTTSKIIVQWEIQGEPNVHNVGFRIYKNGQRTKKND